MSALRQSFNVTNIIADSLRFRDLSNNLLWLTEKGLVTNETPAVSRDLILTGALDASAAYVNTIEASVGAITYLDVSAAHINSLDVSSETVAILRAGVADIHTLDVSSATVAYLDVSEARIHYLDVSDQRVTSLVAEDARIHHMDASSATINNLVATTVHTNTLDASSSFIHDISAASLTLLGTPGSSTPGSGTLTYSQSLGLLVNSYPQGLPPPPIFYSVSTYATLSDLINSYNSFLRIVNGLLVILDP